ncbi:hypothetical protein TIFTF001_045271 [Ficus carica]|uniref:Uncharacterized protein n=1 Tax=Ficus carica TaxID=3494 RepID=A0AA87YVZ9_FICCA|nr:hypothetical protein TIFTF001_045271 [Ficus carica]
MASTALLRTLFMQKITTSSEIHRQVPICKPYYIDSASNTIGSTWPYSSKIPPITRGGGQKINSTDDVAVTENKDSSANSTINQKDGKKNGGNVTDASEKTPEK